MAPSEMAQACAMSRVVVSVKPFSTNKRRASSRMVCLVLGPWRIGFACPPLDVGRQEYGRKRQNAVSLATNLTPAAAPGGAQIRLGSAASSALPAHAPALRQTRKTERQPSVKCCATGCQPLFATFSLSAARLEPL